MKAKLIKTNDEYRLYVDDVLPYATSDNSPYKRLSKQNCDEIFGVVDVEKLAEQSWGDKISSPYHAYIAGFNKAMELNKDKVFTLEDVRMAFIAGSNVFIEEDDAYGSEFQKEEDEFIQSLQQPTEIEVEIEMEVVPDFYSRSDEDGSIFTSNKKEQPKLDSEGCLILKKK